MTDKKAMTTDEEYRRNEFREFAEDYLKKNGHEKAWLSGLKESYHGEAVCSELCGEEITVFSI